MEFYLAVVTIVAAVLYIILFFKVWCMTSDVYDLKKKFAPDTNENFATTVIRLKILGQEEEAYARLNDHLNNCLRSTCNSRMSVDGMQREWIATLASISCYYKMLGKEIPEELKGYNFSEFYEMLYNAKK